MGCSALRDQPSGRLVLVTLREMAPIECLPDVGGIAGGEVECNGVNLARDLPFCGPWESEGGHRSDGFS